MQKIDIARRILPGLLNNPNLSRAEIISRLEDAAQVTHSTAVSYYERIARELGHTNKDRKGSAIQRQGGDIDNTMQIAKSGTASSASTSFQRSFGSVNNTSSQFGSNMNSSAPPELQGMDSDDPNKIGIVRHVDGAHLVFKRQTSNGTFEELWIYKLGDEVTSSDKIKQAIVAGTDIPRDKMQSPDGSQKYEVTTMGDAQYVKITGLPN